MKKLIANLFFVLLGMMIAFIDGVVNLVLTGKNFLIEIPFKLYIESTLANLISISIFVIRLPLKALKNIKVRIIFESILVVLVMLKPSGLLGNPTVLVQGLIVLAGIWVIALGTFIVSIVVTAIVILLEGDPYAELEFELDALEAAPSKSSQEAGVVS